MSEPARITETTALATHPIPEQIWAELESLVPPPEHWLH
jgi:D-threo-aldose 1-dehydrogenase